MASGSVKAGYLGPAGTNTDEALRTIDELETAERVPLGSIREVVESVESGGVSVGLVPIENSIEGSVSDTVDLLVFEKQLQIRREVVRPVDLNLVGAPGLALADITEVVSYPVAVNQCRRSLRELLPGAQFAAANSTAEAVQIVAAEGGTRAAIGTRLSAEIYGLSVLADDVTDHPDAETRFVLVGSGVPEPTGFDKTSIVVFQEQDRPGWLLAILQEFAVRGLNLTRLESRPTKGALGEYYFIIDIEGHVADALLADALRGIKYRHGSVKFLGSYPRARHAGLFHEEEEEAAWAAAGAWVESLTAMVEPSRHT